MKSFSRLLILVAFAVAAPFVSGCRVPLKTPPIQTGAAVPVIDFNRLAEFATAAGNVYESTATIYAAYGASHVVVRDLPGSDGRYFIYFNDGDKTQTVAVRGTANETNAKVDLMSFKIPDAHLGLMVHAGFKRATDELYADIKPYLRAGYRTRVTGHSLGGAMAALLMMHLEADGWPVEQVLTFGQPKVTNEAGAEAHKADPIFRVINDQDIVPQIPPSDIEYDLSGPYEHFGPEIVLYPNGTWSYLPVHVPRNLISDNGWKNIRLQDVGDHQIKNYILRLKAAAAKPTAARLAVLK